MKKGKDGAKTPSKPIVSFTLAFIAGCAVCTCLFILLGSGNNQPHSAQLTLNELLTMPENELGQVDIARINLLCAAGLTGTENLNIEKCLKTIDEWTGLIKEDTQARLPMYYNNPSKYHNSVNLFKVVYMVLYLKDKLSVHYDASCINNKDFSNSDYIFIYGLLNDKHSGTCTSIPTLCVAIGRNLGYPLKLVLAKGHMFFRWEDKKECFNIEACCVGVDAPSDDHYKTGKYALTKADLSRNHYLKSLTPKEELATFMGSRAACLWDTGRDSEAIIACAWENHLSPNHVPTVLTLLSMADRNINQIANEEYKVTGKPAEYAVDLSYEKENLAYIWRQPVEIQRKKSINDLLKNAERNRRQSNPLYYDPVAPTISPQRQPKPITN